MDSFLKLQDDIPSSRSERIINVIKNYGIYRAHQKDGKIFFESTIDQNFYIWEGTIDRSSSSVDMLKVIDKVYDWDTTLSQKRRFREEVLNRITQLRSNNINPKNNTLFYASYISLIRNILGLCEKKDLPVYFPEIAESFFKFFPDGKIVLINRSRDFYPISRIPHILSALHYLSNDDIDELLPDKKRAIGVKTFERSHFWVNRDFYSSILSISGSPLGFTQMNLSHEYLFLLGGELGSKDKNMYKYIYNLQNPMWGDDKKDGHITLDNTSLELLLKWYTDQLNKFLKQILDVTNFKTKLGEIRPNIQYETTFTVDSIIEIYSRLMTTQDILTRKLLFFDFIDRYLALTGIKSIYDLFKKSYYRKMNDSIVNCLPSKLKYRFEQAFKKIYRSSREAILDGIYQASRRKSGNIYLGRNKDIPMESEKYAFSFLDTLRDSLHSYTFKDKDDRFSKLLVIHSGEVSNLIPELSTILFMNLFTNFENIFIKFKRLN